MKIYEVLYIWSNQDDDGFENTHFNTYEAALKKFNDTINDEKTYNESWIQNAFDEQGNLIDSLYQLFNNNDAINGEKELYWCLYSNRDHNTYFQIYLKIFEEAPPAEQYVYQVVFDWSVEDGRNVETYLFSTFEKAKELFFKIIEDEKNIENGMWVADIAFDEDGNLNEDFSLSTNIERYGDSEYLFWRLEDTTCSYLYDNIYLQKRRLDEV